MAHFPKLDVVGSSPISRSKKSTLNGVICPAQPRPKRLLGQLTAR